MIFIILGSTHFVFDRLVKKVDYLVGNKKINDSVFIQLGSSLYEPIHCRWKRFLSFEEMCNKIEKAELVISHAGAGATLLCLNLGKRPILIPRRKKLKEVVDDHQVIFAERMEKLGYAKVASDINDLEHLVQTKTRILENPTRSESNELEKYLRNILVSWNK